MSARVSKHLCVVCASPADLYCARCELAPYCGHACQRADWVARHSAVCHNLVRSSKPQSNKEGNDVDAELSIQPAVPLRKPHSIAVQGAKRDQPPYGNQKVVPSNHTADQKPMQYNNSRGSRNRNHTASNNNYKKLDKKPPANHNIRNHSNGDNDIQTNHFPKSTDQQSTNGEYSKAPVQPQQTLESTNREPSAPLADTVPKVLDTPVRMESVQTMKRAESVNSVTPEPKIVPKSYLLETMSVGDTAMLSVDARAEDCGTKQTGFVCLTINERSEGQFQLLCGKFGQLCAAGERVHSVAPGDSFAYYDSTDESWYRARCLSPASAALVDGCKVVKLVNEDKYTALAGEYADMPEFCCVLRAAGVTLGNNLIATLVSKTASGFMVSLTNVETGASVGEGEVSRWLPDVEYPKPKPVVPVIPEVNRPDVTNNSKVLLVEASAVDRVLVRPADKEAVIRFDSLVEDVVLFGINAKPLTEPPTKGQTVIGLYTDGLHYRALCRRTNVKQNKYLLEYIEFGNSEVTQLEKLFPCPPELSLSSQPTQVSVIRLQTTVTAFTAPASQYLEKIRDDYEELVLTIASGAKTASTGAEVCLTVAKNKESINRKVTEMSTPEWKKIEERGGDVLESEVIMNDHLQYLELPEGGCELDVLDISALACGTVSACERGCKHAKFVLGPLTSRIAEYCDSQIGKEPYLPALMEVCIAKCPPYPQWFRAVLVDHKPGEQEAKVCYVDYGNIESVPVSSLRKMVPEFVEGVPALALHVEIKDFPEDPTAQQLRRAITHMQITDEGRGMLRAARCEQRVHGVYGIEAPSLLAAMLE